MMLNGMYANPVNYFIFITMGTVIIKTSLAGNLTCYQCERYDNDECGQKDLQPCPSPFDRCAVFINKDDKRLFIRRECALGPCSFDDNLMTKGLGMDCDTTKNSYFCTFCCRGNGCNKNGGEAKRLAYGILFFIFPLIVF
ncbi:hypothetical protein ABEB36_008918 [Hypothenemus hampei]|uniref:Uncharacterized protein n=1 Tax=Hypothenemus hampei TaxID=57062 RepID=A0ABD1ERG0_HYPHA